MKTTTRWTRVTCKKCLRMWRFAKGEIRVRFEELEPGAVKRFTGAGR